MDEVSGLITTSRRLDCELPDTTVLTVLASDSGGIVQSATATVEVHLVDRLRNAPTFERSFYTVDVAEDTARSTCILQVGHE